MMAKSQQNPLFDVLKAPRHRFTSEDIVRSFARVNEDRVVALAASLSNYIQVNLPLAVEKRDGLQHYRTNPYVLLTSASAMDLSDPVRFADFLFNSKLYMALETSFGKSVERAFVAPYPIGSVNKWSDAPEKVAEFALLAGLSRQERALRRTDSVWREIDKSCVVGQRRYLASIKSGPNTINDTQVQAMTRAIIDYHQIWTAETKRLNPKVTEIDVVLGLTYGTDRTTNNKENQILVKLLNQGFIEEDRQTKPGVLIDASTRSLRVYRRIGKDFWAFIGDPGKPERAGFVFLEILLALAKALSTGIKAADMETRINLKLQSLAKALSSLSFARKSLPEWVRQDFSDDELFWFATAMTAFYDEGV